MDVGATIFPTYTENLSIWFKEASQNASHKAG